MAFIQAMWNVMLALAPWLLLGAVVAGVMHVALPRDFVRRQLSGVKGVFKAVILGVPLPLCSCGVIPAGLGLKEDGASDGAAVGFLISTPQTGVDSILVSASFLGWPFALFKVLSATATGLAGGLVTHALTDHDDTAAPIDKHDAQQPRTWRGAVDHAVMILRTIWRWLVFGVVVSALIEVFVPAALFEGLAAQGPIVAALAVLVVSLPMYVCATASVPIAAALVAGGLPAGAALVFLMAGPATNVATIGAIYRSLGRRSLIIYLSTIVIGSVGFGLLFDSVLDGSATTMMHHEHGAAWWAVASAIALTGLLTWFATKDVMKMLGSRNRDDSAPALELGVEGMKCGGCASKIETVLSAEDGVTSVSVSLEPGRVVIYGTIPPQRARTLIEEAGFSVP